MKCYVCESDLIWGGDHDAEDVDGNKLIETNLSCSQCEAKYLVYYPVNGEDNENS